MRPRYRWSSPPGRVLEIGAEPGAYAAGRQPLRVASSRLRPRRPGGQCRQLELSAGDSRRFASAMQQVVCDACGLVSRLSTRPRVDAERDRCRGGCRRFSERAASSTIGASRRTHPLGDSPHRAGGDLGFRRLIVITPRITFRDTGAPGVVATGLMRLVESPQSCSAKFPSRGR